ncbi:hypothetical protein MKX03_027227 [Papaver bracteatum]|nr:hypothetical protein MKX03_027227 [Papaver bracteatum]
MSPMMSTNSSSTSASLLENPPTTTSSSLKFIDFFRRIYDEHYPPGFLKKVLAELIAIFLLVFVTCGSAALSNSDESRVSKLGACIAGGLIVTVMIYAVGHVSGAHMNPAVTCAFAAVRHFSWKQVPFYAAAQLTGALVASFTLLILLQPIKNIGTTSPSGTDFQALTMEIVAVGSAVCITSILAGPVSGGSMNPVRTIGPAIASKHNKGIWVYIVGPLFGTLTVHIITPSLESSSIRIRRFLSNYHEQADVTPKKDPLQII